MKLLTEFVALDQLSVLVEESANGNDNEKIYRLKGPFLEAETKNRNGRIYPKELLVREVKRYNEEKISNHRAIGELDHPENPQINLERVSHIIESLVMDGNKGIGVARILDTPMGKIAKTLVKEGIILGMSTRGVGSLDGERVKEDFSLISIDAVADPSAASAFVEGVLENKDYILDGDQIVEVAVEKLKKEVDKKYSGKDLSEHTLRLLLGFINDIKSSRG